MDCLVVICQRILRGGISLFGHLCWGGGLGVFCHQCQSSPAPRHLVFLTHCVHTAVPGILNLCWHNPPENQRLFRAYSVSGALLDTPEQVSLFFCLADEEMTVKKKKDELIAGNQWGTECHLGDDSRAGCLTTGVPALPRPVHVCPGSSCSGICLLSTRLLVQAGARHQGGFSSVPSS